MNDEFIVPTGRIIREYLEANKINPKELSAKTGLSVRDVSNLLNGKVILTEEIAEKIASVIEGVPASYWLKLENKYRAYLLTKSNDIILKNDNLEEIAKRFKFSEVFSGLDWDLSKQAKEMLKLLNIKDFSNFEAKYSNIVVNFMEDGGEFEPTVIWLQMCEEEIELQNGELSISFDKMILSDKLTMFKNLALIDTPDSITKNCRKLCNRLGIYLVICEAVTNSKVRGALTTYKNNPAIYLSGRFKTHDHIWFAFFHEIAHLLFHYSVKDTIISYEIDEDINISNKEQEANEFARNILIDSNDYFKFVKNKEFTERSVRIFANIQGVLPGIVVARLQHDKYIERSELNHLKSRFNINLP